MKIHLAEGRKKPVWIIAQYDAPIAEGELEPIGHRGSAIAQEEREQLRELARDLGLVITGASDYHGTGKLNSIGENHTDPAEWARLESMADARRVVTE